ncbi:LysM peptidoglycan-binding domain-containing protein [Salicibibacter halophilus]|uniref:LysM peptidoglycan-binding domain-containing protein n=1 Tax=Salicibibacter halophilus TaxID=2502791 RepID=A0A514LHG2_9BACI|nr:LysM peptidoglycan-binding domain-containing protein [Salicibibacter halophilus]QDI90721.1 LysM peptidoglycan-binding domain-containing protein [Salicibibacter halophilus]
MPIVRGTYIVYTVQPNDTLFTIANRLGSNVPGLSQINGIFPPFLEPEGIYPGQWLIAPVPDSIYAQSRVLYVVQPGDSLYGIAQDFSIPAQNLINANPQLEALQPFQLIEVPVNVFAVSTGDSLFSISQSLGASPQTIIQMNQRRPGFSPSVLPPGYGLLVP